LRVAYILNFRLLGRIGATRTSLLAYLLPIVGIVTGALMFGEQIDARVILGTGLVSAGVALVNSRYGQRRLFGRNPPGQGHLTAPHATLPATPSPSTSVQTRTPTKRARRTSSRIEGRISPE